MGAMTDLLGKRVYLDANVFIYALNGFPPFLPFLKGLFDASDAQQVSAVTSELTVAEVLVAPFRDSDADKEQACRRMLKPDEGLTLLPVTMPTLERAAHLRASNRALRLPDAIHLAAAIESNCDLVLTNDQRLKAAPQVPVMLLSELGQK